MTGSNVAEHLQRYSAIPRLTCVSLCIGDDFTFAATESELRKMRSRMRELYDVKVRGILGRGKRDVETEEV